MGPADSKHWDDEHSCDFSSHTLEKNLHSDGAGTFEATKHFS